MPNTTIGGEIELTLIDNEGYISNKADLILNDPKNDGSITDEGTHAQVEVNLVPAKTIQELDNNAKKQLSLLEEICTSYDVKAVPVSEYGAGRGERQGKSEPENYRWPIYNLIFGEKGLEELYTNSGIHLHLSQIPGKELQQFHILQALDPLSYALTSTSPINYQGKNSLSCHRINTQRNRVFQKFPLHAQLLDYPSSLEELKEIENQRWEQWREIALKNGIDPQRYDKKFQPSNTGYTPIRKRDNIGPTGTLEVRSFDTAPLDITLAVFALYKGIHDYALEKNTKITISEQPHTYSFSDGSVILPNIKTLKEMENETVKYGLRSNLITEYLSHLLPFAEQGLPQEDKIYLQPIKEMLVTKINPAHKIMEFMNLQGYQGPFFSPEQSAQANLFMRDWHLKTLNNNYKTSNNY